MERETKHRPAGFRTHILVCMGSTTIMILSEYLFVKYHTLYGISSDPARMSAQVISGIGFLGAGTIVHYGSNVKGLTTAASLWAVAAIGLTVGAGFYSLAITVSVVLYITLLVFNKISLKISKQGNVVEMLITLLNNPNTLGAINIMLGKNNVKILDMRFLNPIMGVNTDNKDNDIINIRIVAQLVNGAPRAELLSSIRSTDGVIDVERL